jgi:hypothetical protein
MSQLRVALRTVVDVLADIARLGLLTLHSRTQLAAENMFLRKQLALYLERPSSRAGPTTRPASHWLRCRDGSIGVSCWWSSRQTR